MEAVMSGKVVKYSGLVVVLLCIAIQFIQPNRINPPSNPASSFEAVANPGPEVAAIVRRSCYDCHSNNTIWPWYSHIAPVSWLVADDVKEGRTHLNFSEWGFYSPEISKTRLKEMCNEVKSGGMPLRMYTIIHSNASLSPEDVKSICGAAQ
jgi:hypothetical protein